MNRIILVGLAGFAAVVVYFLVSGQSDPTNDLASAGGQGGALVEIVMPAELSANAQIGQTAYEAKCAACHGVNSVGQDGVAPPLVHVIYEPSHHGDEAFQRAVAMGVRGHHWPFGNMPAVEGLTRGDVAMIVAYIRELQQANGIN